MNLIVIHNFWTLLELGSFYFENWTSCVVIFASCSAVHGKLSNHFSAHFMLSVLTVSSYSPSLMDTEGLTP
jgi:hypothetical protein